MTSPPPSRSFDHGLEAAVENDDPEKARRLLADAPFSPAQRQYVEDVLAAWERERAGRA